MAENVLSTDVVERTEELVDLIDFRRQWDGPAFNLSSYEHVIPLFESTYKWVIFRNYRTSVQRSRQREIMRAASEIWPEYSGNNRYASYVDPTLSRAAIFNAHIAAIQSGFGPRDVPITEWPIDRLILEYENAHEMRNIYKLMTQVLGGVGLGNRVAQTAAKRYAITAALKLTGPVGAVATYGSALITYTAMRYEIKKIADIDIEITLKRTPGEISAEDWDAHERRIEDKYGSQPEPDELR